MLLAKTITTITIGADKIQRLTLKAAFNCTYQPQKSCAAHPARYVPPWGKKAYPAISPFFFFLPRSRRQSINQNQTL
jgi:hypothetical protein